LSAQQTLVAAVFLATYGGVALGRLPFTRHDRAGVALIGATAMVVCGGVTLDQAFQSIDLGALALRSPWARGYWRQN
jgi:Na+/H+ antiporter NhaD/arsenite permease-like protein